ncbi:MAG: tetraacyldisaccharide 4'-kinase [Rickettsiales bacterium]|nr:tetraacyldisaccharide 4'-kinase [Rickettsiales bacterium]
MKTPKWFLRKSLLSCLLWPFSILYLIGFYFVFIFRCFSSKTSKKAVICVGAIWAGGVGKTPIVRELATRINAAVVMRGYGGRITDGHRATQSDTAADIGDEAKMLSATGLPVYVGNRSESICLINSRADENAIILDDGFQNPTIPKKLSILVFDESLGIGNGLCLPAGPLREPLLPGLLRADAIILIQSPNPNYQTGRLLRLAKILRRPVFYARKYIEDPGYTGKVVAFAGIGYPEKFFNSVRQLSGARLIESISFPDHHQYSKSDFVNLFAVARRYDAKLICTEKDWVKFPNNIGKKIKFLPLGISIGADFYDWMNKKLKK